MLVITRRKGEALQIGDAIQVRVLDIIGSQVRIEIEAPKDTVIVRKELKPLEQFEKTTP